MKTSIGIFLRKLRLSNGEILRDMATKLVVTSSFLSAVENGKKKMPDSWEKKLKDIYSLSATQMNDLRIAVMESSDVVELNISDKTSQNRDLAILFARQFDTMDDETSKELLAFLRKKGNKEDD